jgi:hypothetical protein
MNRGKFPLGIQNCSLSFTPKPFQTVIEKKRKIEPKKEKEEYQPIGEKVIGNMKKSQEFESNCRYLYF